MEDVIFVVGVTIYPVTSHDDDVDHFNSDYPLFITTSKEEAIKHVRTLNVDKEEVYRKGQYAGIVVMERVDDVYVPTLSCRVPGIIDHHIGVYGINDDFHLLPESSAELEDDVWCVGLIGDMQYFTGCFLTIALSSEKATHLKNVFSRNSVATYSRCKQRVSTNGGYVWWK